jgi:hypothetical protein
MLVSDMYPGCDTNSNNADEMLLAACVRCNGDHMTLHAYIEPQGLKRD